MRLTSLSDSGLSNKVRTNKLAIFNFFTFVFRPLRRTRQQARLPTVVEMGAGMCIVLLLSKPSHPWIRVGDAFLNRAA